MHRVEFICPELAILTDDGAPSSDKYHLRDLLALKAGSRDFLSKQVVPFLEKYGARYRLDIDEGFPLSSVGLCDEPLLHRLGFEVCVGEVRARNSKATLRRIGQVASDSDAGAFLVPIEPVDEHLPSLFSRMHAADYVARLGLMSLTGDPNGLEFEYRGRHGESYRFTLPEELAPVDDLTILDESIGAGSDAEPLHARLRRIQGSQFELTFSLVRTWELQQDGTRKTIYFDYVPLSGDEASPGAANMIAADLMLIALSDVLRHRVRSLRIAPRSLRLNRIASNTLVDDLLDATTAGKLHACPNCGRPLIGNSFYCKYGACAQRYNERAKAAALVGGMSEQEVLAAFSRIQPKTVHSWFE